jgi:hypothetical protein
MALNEQEPLKELLSELSDKINLYLQDHYIYELCKKSGISRPIVVDLKNNRITRSNTLETLISVANAIGYKVDGIKLSKIEEVEVR